MNDEFPCKCGHRREWHERLMPHDMFDCCVRCIALTPTPTDLAYCHDYEPDNLRYLEVKSAQKEI
jgi:hypothetical protein